jgi:hypothetical protein
VDEADKKEKYVKLLFELTELHEGIKDLQVWILATSTRAMVQCTILCWWAFLLEWVLSSNLLRRWRQLWLGMPRGTMWWLSRPHGFTHSLALVR